MRVLPLVLAFFPSFVLADDINLASKVSNVTLYPQGAKVVRKVPFSAAEGAHQLRLVDLPRGTPMESLRVMVEGAVMGAVTLREDYVPPVGDVDSAAVKAARDEVERISDAVRAKADEAAALRLMKQAAETRIGFLRQLGKGETLAGAGSDALRDVARMIGDETLAALGAVLKAEAEARVVDKAVGELKDDLAEAERALRALVPQVGERNLVAVDITATGPVEGMLTLAYNTWDAGWRPVYDVHLDRGDAAALTYKRGALIVQETGENWEGVALTLSTNRPSGQSAPGELWPDLRQIGDPEPVRPLGTLMRKDMAQSGAVMDAPMPAPVMVEEAHAQVNLDGMSVTYAYPSAVDLASDADAVRIALGKVKMAPKVQALAVPRRDEVAFLTAAFTNESGEMILPSGETQFFLDGEFIGSRATGHIAAGQEARLSFGPIDGLRLSRVVKRNEGERGVLSRSNEKVEKAQIKVENLTGRAWDVRLVDQVPYSEQEDLSITWNAAPMPQERDVDDKKGVLAWEFEIAPGARMSIGLNHTIDWPEGKVLR